MNLFRNREERENPGGALTSDCRGNLRRIHNEFQEKHDGLRIEQVDPEPAAEHGEGGFVAQRGRLFLVQVRFLQEDYRDINTGCDAFVSIGMLEHVGLANYGRLGALIQRCLKPDGFGLIHSIGRSHPAIADPWITKYIFPGGYIPSLGEMTRVFEPYRFSILDVENLRPHYARTCALWLENFEAAAGRIAERYGDEFVRMWRLYLAGSSAGFKSGTLQLFQILFTPNGNNEVPWTRRYQYEPKERLS